MIRILLAGLVFLDVCSLSGQTAFPYVPPGKLIDLGGYRVHLHCTGAEQPTVMIVGAGFSFDWELVQTKVEKFARVCTYDPAGTVWSDPGSGTGCRERVDQIDSLLRAAGVKGPYIAVGLSIGALVARLYAAEHRDDVAGMVIIDHAFLPDDPPSVGGTSASSSGLNSPPVLIDKTPIVFTVEDDPAFSRLPKRIQEMHRKADSLDPALPTLQEADECLREVEAAEKGLHPLGSVPLVVVSTENDSPGYSRLQSKLLSLSERSRQIMARESFHSVEISEPEVAAEAIRQAVEAARGHIELQN
jgi:pimeloyl-ACP methyl ester carboxylesterase